MEKKFLQMEPRVMVIGDYMIDEYFFGSCERISPEAPVPIIKFLSREFRAGGAGNVEKNLLTLGAQTRVWFGRKDQQTHKMRVICQGQQVVRLDMDNAEEVSPPKNLWENLEWADVIVLCDYGKGVINSQLIKSIDDFYSSRWAINKGKRPLLLVDPYMDKVDYGENVFLIKPNEKECKSVSKHGIPFFEAAHNYLEKSKSKYLLVTAGSRGMFLFDNGKYKEKPFVVESEVKQVYDVTGAGDTAIATMAFIMASEHFSAQTAVKWANRACGIVVGKQGTAMVSFDELFGPYLKENFITERRD